GLRSAYKQRSQASALDLARKYVDDPKKNAELGKAEAALMYRDLGEFRLRADEVNAQGNKPVAQEYFERARNGIRDVPNEWDRDLYRLELAVLQLELGGDPDQVLRKVRMRWHDVQREVQQTLDGLGSAEARAEAIRLITR